MALSATPIIPVLDPNSLDSAHADSKVYPPQSGTTTTSNDVGAGEQILRNQTHTLNELKANLSGATFTGLVTVTQGTANTSAIVTTANGTGYGINATGGATGGGALFTAGGGNNIGCYGLGRGTQPGIQGLGGATGPGGNFAAGGGNASGVTSTGDGSGSGIVATGGATGPGITATSATAQTNTAPTCAGRFAGYIQLTGTAPNPGVNPGAANALHVSNMCHARCTIELATGGPFTPISSYNIDNVTEDATGIYTFEFERIMSVADYTVMLTCRSPAFDVHLSLTSTTVVEINVFNFATRNLDGGTVTVDLLVFAQQS
jgi:hypothetical protein